MACGWRVLLVAVLGLNCGLPAAAESSRPELGTLAERSGFRQTGRYDEVIALCAAFAQRWPQAVRCAEFGRTPEDRPMLALIVSPRGALTPRDAIEAHLPVLLIQGGIHAGEIDGKDAGFLALREALESRQERALLDKQVIVFVPVFNVDGHERFGPNNRPNQVGPEAMGWRTTAQNLNLNRDYMKADAPEMQAMLRLVNEWNPVLAADLHVTDGAKFQPDISITLEPKYSGDEPLRGVGRALQDELLAMLRQQGSMPLPFYPSFKVDDDPASGFEDGVSLPRFSSGYFVLRNRLGVLVETHSWKDYATRVRATRHALDDLFALAAAHGADWLAATAAADRRAAHLDGAGVPLQYAASERARTIDFPGYAYTRTVSPISGAPMTRYDDRKKQVWRVPMRDDVQPTLTVPAPRGGYVIPAAEAAWLKPRLELHELFYKVISVTRPATAVQVFHASSVKPAATSFEGRQMVEIAGAWQNESRERVAGSIYVPINQPNARLLMALLEPQAPDSLVAWGFFNNSFERKEYLEDYVTEEAAEEMLAADPALRAQFEKKLADDPAFAADPRQRLEYFERRHPSWDARFDVYPILRVDD